MNTNIVLDPARFPMIRVDRLGGYLHWLPMTKIQFEHFLWDATPPGLDQAWLARTYENRPERNPRISPQAVGTPADVWKLFLTGVAPCEAAEYAAWASGACDDERYALPTVDQWKAAYAELEARKEGVLEEILRMPDLAPLAGRLLRQVARHLALDGKPLVEQMLMTGGVLEWVDAAALTQLQSPYALMGAPRIAPLPAALERPEVHGFPRTSSEQRMRHRAHGFRLVRLTP